MPLAKRVRASWRMSLDIAAYAMRMAGKVEPKVSPGMTATRYCRTSCSARRRGGDVGEESGVDVKGALRGAGDEEIAKRVEHFQNEVARGFERGDMATDKFGAGGNGGEGCLLGDVGRADENGVLDFFYGGVEFFGDDHVADAPGGKAVGFGEGEKGDGVIGGFGDGGGGEMRGGAVGEIFICFVGDVIDAGVAAELVDFVKGFLGIDGAGGIVRGDGDDGTSPVGDGVADGIEIGLIIVERGDNDGLDAGDREGHFVVEVIGGVENDFIAGIGDGQGGVHKGHVAAGGDDEARGGHDLDAVLLPEFLFKGIDQRREAADVGIHVIAGLRPAASPTIFGAAEAGGGFQGLFGRTPVHDALAEGMGAWGGADPFSHDWDDGGLDLLHAAGNHGGAC